LSRLISSETYPRREAPLQTPASARPIVMSNQQLAKTPERLAFLL
jgi:hypothetical protein